MGQPHGAVLFLLLGIHPLLRGAVMPYLSFFRADLSITGNWLNPIQKPWVKPGIKKSLAACWGTPSLAIR